MEAQPSRVKTSVPVFPGMSQKFQKDNSSKNGYIPIFVQFQSGSNKLTGIQEIHSFFELVCQHPRSVSKNFQKYITSRSGDNPIFV